MPGPRELLLSRHTFPWCLGSLGRSALVSLQKQGLTLTESLAPREREPLKEGWFPAGPGAGPSAAGLGRRRQAKVSAVSQSCVLRLGGSYASPAAQTNPQAGLPLPTPVPIASLSQAQRMQTKFGRILRNFLFRKRTFQDASFIPFCWCDPSSLLHGEGHGFWGWTGSVELPLCCLLAVRSGANSLTFLSSVFFVGVLRVRAFNKRY